MYSDKNPKIDVYVNGVYKGSTNWSKTCKEAKEVYLKKYPGTDPKSLKCKKSK